MPVTWNELAVTPDDLDGYEAETLADLETAIQQVGTVQTDRIRAARREVSSRLMAKAGTFVGTLGIGEYLNRLAQTLDDGSPYANPDLAQMVRGALAEAYLYRYFFAGFSTGGDRYALKAEGYREALERSVASIARLAPMYLAGTSGPETGVPVATGGAISTGLHSDGWGDPFGGGFGFGGGFSY